MGLSEQELRIKKIKNRGISVRNIEYDSVLIAWERHSEHIEECPAVKV
jgi:hypothetical protein